jgi:glycerol kinase
MESDSGVEALELRVDGGAAQNDWLMGFQADILGIPVRRPGMVETTALGAAGLAGLAVGVWQDGGDFLQALGHPSVFSPQLDPDARNAAMRGWRRALEAALAWADSKEG